MLLVNIDVSSLMLFGCIARELATYIWPYENTGSYNQITMRENDSLCNLLTVVVKEIALEIAVVSI